MSQITQNCFPLNPQIVWEQSSQVPKTGPRSNKYGSKDGKKIRILSYLFQHSEGANKNTINAIPGFNTQRWDKINEILVELAEADSILVEKHDEVKQGSVLYKITPKGRETIEKLKSFQSAGLGRGLDFFDSLESD